MESTFFFFLFVCLVSRKHSFAYWLWLSLYPLFLQLCFIIVLCLHDLFFFSNITDKSPILGFFLLREIRGSYENRGWKWGSPLTEHPDRNKIYSYLLLAKCLDSCKGVAFCWVTFFFVVFGSLIWQDTVWQEKLSSWYSPFSQLQCRCLLGYKSSMKIIESTIGRIETSCLSESGFLQVISVIC